MERRAALRKERLGAARRGPQAKPTPQKVEVENVLRPGTTRVDSGKYEAMKRAYLKVLPGRSPGLTVAEILAGVIPHLPDELFPQGATAGWWAKAVQLDLEAKGVVVRENVKPLRLHKA